MSVNFQRATNVCTLNTGTMQPEGEHKSACAPVRAGLLPLTTTDGTDFYDETCITPPSDNSRQCAGPYVLAPKHILVGFANVIVDAQSLQQCLQQCIYSMQLYNIVCRSGIIFYGEQKQNCILTTETRTSQPNAYSVDTDGSVDYFEPRCSSDPPPTTLTGRSAGVLLAPTNEWGVWSACVLVRTSSAPVSH
jgi:hypothetical protein